MMKRTKFILIATTIISLSHCKTTSPIAKVSDMKSVATTDTDIQYPAIDPELGESLRPSEILLAPRIAQAIEGSLAQKYQSNRVLRDAHPKTHGCVAAKFMVNENLPPQLAHGVFEAGKTYPAWIRFSNGDSDATRPDIKGDARGMAIKLMDVPGKKLLESDSASMTQDFIMINHPVFFVDDPEDYLTLIERVGSTNPLVRLSAPFALGFKGALIANAITSKTISNPLQTRYWSMTPYRLGSDLQKQAIKFSAKPCAIETDPIPSRPTPNYLSEAMAKTLSSKQGCFEFFVQPRNGNSQSVENSMEEWKESDAPFIKVASIVIPQQQFNTAEQMSFCDQLSFNPWHALPEHKPLGAINRMRKVIYNHISNYRHRMNQEMRAEPTTE